MAATEYDGRPGPQVGMSGAWRPDLKRWGKPHYLAIAEALAEGTSDAAAQRQTVGVWRSIQASLRHPIANYVKAKGHDVGDVVAKADALDEELKQRIAAGEDADDPE